MLKDSLYKAFTSQINYVNYMEAWTTTVDGKTDFELLQAIYSGFLYTVLFEDYFTVKNKKVTTLLSNDYIEKLINMIAVKTTSGYVFGVPGKNLRYNSKELAFYKIRNKIAHGDFYVEKGNIVFEEKGSKGIIELKKFTAMLVDLEHDGNSNKKYEINHRLLYINRTNDKALFTENTIDRMSKDLYQVMIKNKPLPFSIRNNKYVEDMERIICRISDCIEENRHLPMEECKRKIDECISENKKNTGIDIEYSIIPTSNLPEYKEIREKFLNRKQKIKNNYGALDKNGEVDLLGNIVYEYVNENEIEIRKGILLNVVMLDYLRQKPLATRNEIIENIDHRISKFILYDTDEVIMMSYLVGFYSLFQYGLETSMTKCNERNMYDIYNKSNLDFSKLNVDTLDTNNRTVGIPKPKLDYSKEKASRLISSENGYFKLLDGYNNLANKMSNDLEKIKHLKEKLEVMKEEYQKLRFTMLNDICKYAYFLSDFDFDGYINNLDIIYHVRNAIAHGNIIIVSYGESLDDTVIQITDRSEGRIGDIVYDKEITIREFNRIFSDNNVKLLYNFLAEHADSSEIVEEDYLEKVYKRLKR